MPAPNPAYRPGLADRSDAELMAAYVLDKDQDALAAIIARYGNMIYAVCRHMLWDEHGAEDAAQVVMLAFCRQAPRLPPRMPLGPWLHRVARLTAISLLRRRSVRSRHENRAMQERAMDAKQTEAAAVGDEILATLHEAVGRLTPKLQAAVVLRYLSGMSHEEVAERLGCSVSTASMRVARGVESLRRILAKAGVAGSAAMLTGWLGQASAAVPPAGFAGRLMAACTGQAAMEASALGVLRAVERALFWSKVKIAGVCGLAGVIVAGGTAAILAPGSSDPRGSERTVAPAGGELARVDPATTRVGPSVEPAAAAAPSPPRTETFPDREIYDIALGDLSGSPSRPHRLSQARFRLFVHGEKVYSAYCVPAGSNRVEESHLDARGLTRRGDELKGRLVFDDKFRVSLDLSLTLGDAVGGSVACGGATAPVRGGRRSLTDLATREDPIRPTHGWPQIKGVDGRGCGVPIERPVVDDIGKVRFVWKSEDAVVLGAPRKAGGSHDGAPTFTQGGAGSVVVSEGALVYSYYVPSPRDGPVFGSGKRSFLQVPQFLDSEFGRVYMRRDADDAIVCLDPLTGLTRWRTVVPSRALNIQGQRKGSPGTTPCIADGRVFAVGHGGYVYGLDLETGAVLWEQGTLRGSRKLIAIKDEILAAKEISLFGFGQNVGDTMLVSGPVAAGGAVAIDMRTDGVAALDPATGRILWEEPAGRTGWRGFVRVASTPDGPRFAFPVSVNRQPRLVFVEPRTGKRTFEAAIPGPGGQAWCLHGDVFMTGTPFCQGGHIAKSKERVEVAGYRVDLSRNALVPLWTHRLDRIDAVGCVPIFEGGKLLVGGHRDAAVARIDPASGAFDYLPPIGGQGGFMQMVAGYGRLFRPSGGTGMMRLDPADPGQVTEFEQQAELGYEDVMPDIALCDGRMFVRLVDGVACFDLRTPND
jgi:RNA polymerase sigma factor (sigma-70 family)